MIVSSLTPDISFMADLAAEPALSPGNEVISDFDHTGMLSISLPPGVAFTSDSGVLLSKAASVPEPASASLLVATIAVLGLTRRRRRCERSHGDHRYPKPQRE